MSLLGPQAGPGCGFSPLFHSNTARHTKSAVTFQRMAFCPVDTGTILVGTIFILVISLGNTNCFSNYLLENANYLLVPTKAYAIG